MSAYHRRLAGMNTRFYILYFILHVYFINKLGTDKEAMRKCAQAWTYWEMTTCKLIVDKEHQVC